MLYGGESQADSRLRYTENLRQSVQAASNMHMDDSSTLTVTQSLLVRHLPVSPPQTFILCSIAQQDSFLKPSALLMNQLGVLDVH